MIHPIDVAAQYFDYIFQLAITSTISGSLSSPSGALLFRVRVFVLLFQ